MSDSDSCRRPSKASREGGLGGKAGAGWSHELRFGQRQEGGKGAGHVVEGKKSILGRGNRQFKRLEVKACLVVSSSSKEEGAAGVEQVKGRGGGGQRGQGPDCIWRSYHWKNCDSGKGVSGGLEQRRDMI